MNAQFQPAESDVNNFLSLVGNVISRQEAVARLKGNNNSIDQAIGEYYDSPDNSKYRWDEGQFNSGREGEYNNHNISFDIHAPDDPGPFPQHFDGGPSRPPSRTSNSKSPLSRVIDLTSAAAAADPRSSTDHDYNGDLELEQALAASRAEAGMPPQESGITGTEVKHFGPANRSEYEQGQWDMVPTGSSSAREILSDPEPADRKREPGAPAFLKPSSNDTRLNAIVTIYHEIPLARSLFLNSEDHMQNYGFDPEWWSGKMIDNQAGDMDDENYPLETCDRELQRLMALLDNTERSYGSVEPLAERSDVKKARNTHPFLPAAMFLAWKDALETRDPTIAENIFSTGVPSEERETKEDEQAFAILELDLPPKDSTQETLYDIADEVLWPQLGSLEYSECPYLSRIAPIISFRIDGVGDRKAIEVPLVWYPDRYLKSGRQPALDMRLQKREVEKELNRIRTLEEKLSFIPTKTGKIVKVQDLFKACLKHDLAELEESEDSLNDADVDMMSSRSSQRQTAGRLSEDMQNILSSIDKKLLSLEEEKQKAREELRKLSKLFTEPSSDPDAPQLHRYTLRGVSTSKSTFYVCRRPMPDLIDMDLDVPDQWWRIYCAPMGYSPMTVEKTTEENVIKAAKESKNMILVYANEDAMDVLRYNHALPKPLETFVKFDNRSFKSEFQGSEESGTVNGDYQNVAGDTLPVGLSSPGKRKYDESSLVNQDSNPYARVNVTARELRNNGELDALSTQQEPPPYSGVDGLAQQIPPDHEVIMGVDPSSIDDTGFETPPPPQEMQERSGMPMLSRATSGQDNPIPIDSMDLIMDDDTVAGESAAVKHVGFVE
ncbi:uncharacterized protein RCO7_05199 [Rhynchosporium graminicola]|uniref:Ubiquitin interaction motif protein n=1 Tax=Rhynchosporium graminicola TaxID=2792576 RepID=A0A1E1L5V9_9HELO|nr:uncharacterized protein RCO7_05199 [Rhynchosporium commune]